MTKKQLEKLYSDEISLNPSKDISDYVEKNLLKVKELRKNFHIPVIGIAGSQGKTTTKRMLSAILSARGRVLETPLDSDSASAVTATLIQLNDSIKYVILELGMVNQEQFKRSVEVSQPTAGIITNIGESNLIDLSEKFVLADVKVELIRKLPPEGFALLNIDDELVSGMEAFCSTPRIIKFGLNSKAHFYASNINYLGPDGMEFHVNDYYRFHLPIYGSTSVSNALAAIATGRILNFEFDEIKLALEKNFELLTGRGNLINLKDVYILDHTYNATVNSVTKACESLVQFRKFSKHLILVLGDLEDLGKFSFKIHKNLGYYISALPIERIITVGKDSVLVGDGILEINHNKKKIEHCFDKEEITQRLLKKLEPDTTILMIGRKSLNLENELQSLVKKIKNF
jgi:UDP-N-acetylmuramoyl-tripeptide--D-alanyl-D-alanine ligase